MPAHDLYHDTVKNALVKDGWTITHDPLRLRLRRGKNLFVDMGAERLLAAERVLRKYAEFLTTDAEIVCETIFDRAGDHYLLVEVGWEDGYRIYGPLLHIDILGGKLWIQQDGTEDGVAEELVAAGVPKDRIVLAFKHPTRWKDTEFAAA